MHAALHSQGYKVVSLLSFDDCVRSESWSSYKENIFIGLKNVTCSILWSISWKYCVLVSKDRGRYSIALPYSAEEFFEHILRFISVSVRFLSFDVN